MTVIRKALATVEPVPESEDYPNGAFDIILSAQTKDRDGEVLKSDEWKLPLPDHITMDSDHGMSVETTVGSGTPFINEAGDLQVRGTFASTPHAQNVRTLVNEGHIRTTSVAFMTEKNVKSGKPVRELLNGAFVAIPSNREAVVLSSKAFAAVSKDYDDPDDEVDDLDPDMLKAIHDAAVHLGAVCPVPGEPDGDEAGEAGAKSFAVVTKGATGSVEDLRGRLTRALEAAGDACRWPWILATFLDDVGSGTVVYRNGDDTLARSFTDNGTAVTLGADVRAVALLTTFAETTDSDSDTESAEPAGPEAGSPLPSASKSPAAAAAVKAAAAAGDATADDVALRARALALKARVLGTTSTDGN